MNQKTTQSYLFETLHLAQEFYKPRMPIIRSFDVNAPSTPMGSLKGAVIGGTLIT